MAISVDATKITFNDATTMNTAPVSTGAVVQSVTLTIQALGLNLLRQTVRYING
jgi:hypothetical protein